MNVEGAKEAASQCTCKRSERSQGGCTLHDARKAYDIYDILDKVNLYCAQHLL